MSQTSCRACERVLDVEPPKCPYCGRAQPPAGALSHPELLARAVGVSAAVVLGMWLGAHAGRTTAQSAVGPSVRSEARLQPPPAFGIRTVDLSAEREAFKERASAALATVKAGGLYRYIQIDDAAVDGPSLEGQRVAVIGLANWLELKGPVPRFALCTGWGSGASLPVDASFLHDGTRVAIQKNYFPPSFWLVEGVLRPSKLADVPGAVSDYHLEAESAQNLGRAPGSGTRPLADYLR